MTALDDWTGAVKSALDLSPDVSDHQDLVLDLAREVAHGVLRPAAPLTAYLVGIAVGRGADPAEAVAAVAALARGWSAPTEPPR